jgi:hypothetical protein
MPCASLSKVTFMWFSRESVGARVISSEGCLKLGGHRILSLPWMVGTGLWPHRSSSLAFLPSHGGWGTHCSRDTLLDLVSYRVLFHGLQWL